MTKFLGPDSRDEAERDLAAYNAANRQQSLDERMTMLELTIGTALWEQGRTKIPRSTLANVANYVAARCSIPEALRLSTISYGQFYNSVSSPLFEDTLSIRESEEYRNLHRGYSGLV